MIAFLKGFGLGFLIIFAWLILYSLYSGFLQNSAIFVSFIIWIAALYYLVRKNNLSHVWIFLGLIFSIIVLPFLLGSIFVQKNKIKSKKLVKSKRISK